MSQEAFYYQVQMEEEYMSKLKAFAEELRSEFLASGQTYCVYCGNEQDKGSCCGQHHFSTFEYITDDVQNMIIYAEIKTYERATK